MSIKKGNPTNGLPMDALAENEWRGGITETLLHRNVIDLRPSGGNRLFDPGF